MRFLVSVALVLTVQNAIVISKEIPRDPKITGYIDDLINKTFTGLVSKLQDPFYADEYYFNFDEVKYQDILQGTAEITSVCVEGLKSILLTEIYSDIFSGTIQMKVVLPQLAIKFKYNKDLHLVKVIPIYGDGSEAVKLNALSFDVSLNFQLGADNTPMNSARISHISNLSILTTIGDAKFKITGLYDNDDLSDLYTQLLNNEFCKWMNLNKKLVSELWSPVLEDIININL